MTRTQEQRNLIGQRAQDIYDSQIRAQVEPEHIGKFLVLDINSGDYEIDGDEIAAFRRMMARRPESERFLFRIGYKAAHVMGGSLSSIRTAPENERTAPEN